MIIAVSRNYSQMRYINLQRYEMSQNTHDSSSVPFGQDRILPAVLIYYPAELGYHCESLNQINPSTITDNCSLASLYELNYLLVRSSIRYHSYPFLSQINLFFTK